MLKSLPRTVTMHGAALPRTSTGEPALLLRAILGEEALSQIYTYTLDCCIPLASVMPEHAAANIDLKSMVGKELTVSHPLPR